MQNMNFKKGQVLELAYPKPSRVRVLEALGGGTQGDVYKVQDLDTGELLALKHLYHRFANDRKRFNGMSGKVAYHRKCILLAREGSPHPAFAWPKSVSRMSKKQDSFLYTMPLLEGYQPVTAAIKSKQLPMKKRAELIKAMAEPISVLHRMGLIFGDISDTNFHYKIDPDGTIHVRIIDCENVNLPKFNMGLIGTGDYRAPELIVPDPANGNKPQFPTIQSDIHGFGVLSFLVFCRHHPLDGELVFSEPDNPQNFMKHYGTNPHFCFGNNLNHPFPLAQSRWAQIPEPMQLYYRHLFSDACLHGQKPRHDLTALLKLLKLSYSI